MRRLARPAPRHQQQPLLPVLQQRRLGSCPSGQSVGEEPCCGLRRNAELISDVVEFLALAEKLERSVRQIQRPLLISVLVSAN